MVQVLDSGLGLKFVIHGWHSRKGFWLGIPFEESSLGYGFGILVWDSGFGFRFGTIVRDSCLEFQL